MKGYLAISIALLASALGGCSHSSQANVGAIRPGSGVPLNPSGIPQNASQASQQSQMQNAGNQMNAQRAKDAAAMAAAQARSGGK